MNMAGLLEAKVAVVRLKHGIVRKWLLRLGAPQHKFDELDRYESRAIEDLHQEAEARGDIMECLSAHETRLEDSHITETGHAC